MQFHACLPIATMINFRQKNLSQMQKISGSGTSLQICQNRAGIRLMLLASGRFRPGSGPMEAAC